MTDKQLSCEAKELIRNYMLTLVAIPAIFLSFGSFVIGFGIKEIAVKSAEIKAQQLEIKLAELIKSAEGVDGQLTSVKTKIADSEAHLAQFLKDPTKFNDAMKLFTEQSDKFDLAAQLSAMQQASLKLEVREFNRLQMGKSRNGRDVAKAANGEHRESFVFPGKVLAAGVFLRSSANKETLEEVSYLNADIDAGNQLGVMLRCRSKRANDWRNIPEGDLGIEGHVWAIYK